MGKVVAFIPVRGGSKSIPLKNIKLLYGKPLVYWIISALERANSVDQIVLATDSDEIEKTVLSFNLNKTTIYKRLPENATDTASTESVMLEYIKKSSLNHDDTFILVQATSPLTQTIHIEEALAEYKKGGYDSMLTCVRDYRFYWNENGTSKNYDYKNRPRRQEFKGTLMENGAFYINSINNILASNNRLSGKIGIYEMPNYTATEIDEPEDWVILENLMQRYAFTQKNIKHNIKLFLTDVDGVLTDAGMYYSERGDEMKKFNTHDGMAFQLLREAGIKVGIITSENTNIVERRAQKLRVDYMYQGQRNGGKLAAAIDICEKENISLHEVAYIGDDINCLELLSSVGVAACPLNAVDKIKQIPHIICLNKAGGEGAVREFVELILS